MLRYLLFLARYTAFFLNLQTKHEQESICSYRVRVSGGAYPIPRYPTLRYPTRQISYPLDTISMRYLPPRRNMRPEIPYFHRRNTGPKTIYPTPRKDMRPDIRKGPDTRDTLPPCEQIDRHLWKYYLPTSTVAGGKNKSSFSWQFCTTSMGL